MEHNKFYSDWGKNKIEDQYLFYTLPFLYDMGIKEGMDVLDVGGFGCGGLNTSVYFKQKGCNIDVMNIDPSVKSLCEQFNVNFIEGDIFTYKDITTTYDIILVELDTHNQIKLIEKGYVDSLLSLLNPHGFLITHITDDITQFPEGEYWQERKKEITSAVENFSKTYCNNIPIEEIMKTQYNSYYIGKDLTRPFMKWFKIHK